VGIKKMLHQDNIFFFPPHYSTGTIIVQLVVGVWHMADGVWIIALNFGDIVNGLALGFELRA
jgi:hypothetical protein